MFSVPLNSRSFDITKLGLMVQLVLHKLLLVNFFFFSFLKLGMRCNKRCSIISSSTPLLLWSLYLLSVITSHSVMSLQGSECGNMGNPPNKLKSMMVEITISCFCFLHLLSHPPFPHRDTYRKHMAHICFLDISNYFVHLKYVLYIIS